MYWPDLDELKQLYRRSRQEFTVRSKKEDETYLHSWEGSTVLFIATILNAGAFATLIDRAPTKISGSEASIEGLIVAPTTGVFPIAWDSFGIFYGAVVALIVWFLTFRIVVEKMDGWVRIKGTFSVFVVYILFWIFDIIALPGGAGIVGRNLLELPRNVYLICFLHGVLVVLPAFISSYPLLPDWLVSEDDREHERRDLKEFIESNWRRTRVVMSITLTGAIGITLPFVLSRASPNFLFLLAIVGYVIVSPLFGIWFLMRRIREAEKELRPT